MLAVQAALPVRLDGHDAAARLAPAAAYAPERPAFAILAGLPFGPSPDRLVPWLLSAPGIALWQLVAGPRLLPVWASPGGAPHFAGSELFVLELAGEPADADWTGAARHVLAGAARWPPAPSEPATEARINAGNRAAAMVERLAVAADPLTRLCLAEMRNLTPPDASVAGHHPLMALAG